MATLQYNAPRAFPKALSGARSTVFPVTVATLVTIPCDAPRFGFIEGDRLLFKAQDHWDCDSIYLTVDGEMVMISICERAHYKRVALLDGKNVLLPDREVGNLISARFKRRVRAEIHDDRISWREV